MPKIYPIWKKAKYETAQGKFSAPFRMTELQSRIEMKSSPPTPGGKQSQRTDISGLSDISNISVS